VGVIHLQFLIHVGTNDTDTTRMWGGAVGGIAQTPAPLLGNLIAVLAPGLHPPRAPEVVEETLLHLAPDTAAGAGLGLVPVPLYPPVLLIVETTIRTRNIIEARTKIGIVMTKNPSIGIGVVVIVGKGERGEKIRGIKRNRKALPSLPSGENMVY